MASQRRRSSTIDRASVESIMNSGGMGKPAAPPSPHIGTSPNRAVFPMSPPARSSVKHHRALSYTPKARPNRLSLSFPVASNIYSNESSAKPTPTSSNQTSFPPTPAESAPPELSPGTDPGHFLVALASQERKVLELKEELAKAEDELTKLKKQWAMHEASRKRAEIRHTEPLQPLSGVVTDNNAHEGTASQRRSVELDRRKALLSNLSIPKDSRRKFSGSHTRALSLLSPERSNFKDPQPFPPLHESLGESPALPRTSTSTMPDTSQGMRKISSSNRARHSYQGGLTHVAKQLGEEVKTGMWNLLEDLRQATVGDEAVNGTTSRGVLDPSQRSLARRGSRSSVKSNGKRDKSPRNSSPRTWDSLTGTHTLLDGPNLWDADQQAPTAPRMRSTTNSKKVARPLSLAAPPIDDLDDGWLINWDSPAPKSPRWSASTTMSDPATPGSGSPDNRNVKIQSDDVSTPSKRSSIQWPALDKIAQMSPTNLKDNLQGGLQRTMSTILNEWERTVTPLTEDDNSLATGNEMPSSHSANSTQDEVLMMSR